MEKIYGLYDGGEELIAYVSDKDNFLTAEDFLKAADKQGKEEMGDEWGKDELYFDGDPYSAWLEEIEIGEEETQIVQHDEPGPGWVESWVVSIS